MRELLIIASLFLTACSTEHAVKNFPHVENIEMNEVVLSDPFLTMGSMFIADDHLVVHQSGVEDMYFKYYSLDDLGFVLGGIQRGRGPDEFVRPPTPRSFIRESSGFSCIVNPFRTHVGIEEGRLKVVGRTELGGIFNFGANNLSKIAEDLYCVSNIDPSQPYEFVLFDKDGENPKYVSPYPNWADADKDELLTYRCLVAANPDRKRFIVFYAFFAKLRLFNSDGKLLKDISVEYPSKFPQYNPDAKKIAYSFFSYKDDKYIYVISNIGGEKEATEIQIWNWDAEPVAILKLNKKVLQFTISHEKKRLYATNPRNDTDNDKIFWCDLPDWLYD